MSRRFYYSFFLILIFLGLGGFISIRLGYFPVAIVNSHLISEAYFNDALRDVIEGYVSGTDIPGNTELKREALQKIIENELVFREAQKYFGPNLYSGERPEAIRALLSDQVKNTGLSFDNWLSRAKRDANVYILVSGFSWTGEKVISCSSDNSNQIGGNSNLPASHSFFSSC